jgi:hypothetical protein
MYVSTFFLRHLLGMYLKCLFLISHYSKFNAPEYPLSREWTLIIERNVLRIYFQQSVFYTNRKRKIDSFIFLLIIYKYIFFIKDANLWRVSLLLIDMSDNRKRNSPLTQTKESYFSMITKSVRVVFHLFLLKYILRILFFSDFWVLFSLYD